MSDRCEECGRVLAHSREAWLDDVDENLCGMSVARTTPMAQEGCAQATIVRLKARVQELENWRPLSEESKPEPGNLVVLASNKHTDGVVVHWIDGELRGPKGSVWWYQLPRLPQHLRDLER